MPSFETPSDIFTLLSVFDSPEGSQILSRLIKISACISKVQRKYAQNQQIISRKNCSRHMKELAKQRKMTPFPYDTSVTRHNQSKMKKGFCACVPLPRNVKCCTMAYFLFYFSFCLFEIKNFSSKERYEG